MFPNDLHMLLNASGKHQGSGRKPKGASKDQPAGAVKSSVNGSEMRRSPVELDSLSHDLQGFISPRISMDFHQQYGPHILMIF